MKKVALTTVVIGTLLGADGALAKPHEDGQRHFNKDRSEQRYDGDGRRDRHEQRHHHRGHFNKHDLVRIDIPVRVRGDERVHLRRLLKNRHGINPDNYRLRKVVIDNHSRHHGSARLKVGGKVSEPHVLRRGSNHLHAPHYSNGRWVLGLRNAKVSNIRVVLEPRNRYAYNHPPRRWMHRDYH